jgi:hypothetical protein
VVFRFWKKKPVKLLKYEEVEISCSLHEDASPEVFVTKVLSQSPQRILLHLPPMPVKHHLIQHNSAIMVHFRRDNNLGSFGSTIIDIFKDEIPPSFSIAVPSQILWEEIVPAKLASKPQGRSHRRLFLKARLDDTETDGMIHALNARELVFSCSRSFQAGDALMLLISMPEGELAFQAEVLKSSESPDEGLYEVMTSTSGLKREDHERIRHYLMGEKS